VRPRRAQRVGRGVRAGEEGIRHPARRGEGEAGAERAEAAGDRQRPAREAPDEGQPVRRAFTRLRPAAGRSDLDGDAGGEGLERAFLRCRGGGHRGQQHLAFPDLPGDATVGGPHGRGQHGPRQQARAQARGNGRAQEGREHENAERQRAERIISRGKREWEATFDAVADSILITDQYGMIIRCNRSAIQRTHTTFNELIGRSIDEVFFGESITGQTRFPGQAKEVEFPALAGWFEVASYPLMVEGVTRGTIYTVRDVTERKCARAEILLQEQQCKKP